MAKAKTVDAYIKQIKAPLRGAAEAVRELVNAALPQAAVESIKWAQPTWKVGDSYVCYLKAASKHVTFGFWRGKELDDPRGLLESGGQMMAHVKLRGAGDVNKTQFRKWIRQAARLAQEE